MSADLIQATLTQRLADTVFLPFPEIARRARLWGLAVEEGDEQLTFRTSTGFVAGMAESTDPINRAVILAMALVGFEVWPHAFPTLLTEVQKRWKVTEVPQ